ncbi:hypothetical protein SSP24_10630 [Streptomyces spinoverrucosus]|uniref:Uncharacterized protein n=1 Tax=Streptomyces spinoverrucosus TaxID=284043 RepID=A0A4Y3VBD4_9ACTN|nr:hypothetical protein SSP24_10630 [Streptomyces spinoverrucosus]GHB35899.1 hypothetical protein GCM10010397_01940 [Streptomyces spinoverrucosus]
MAVGELLAQVPVLRHGFVQGSDEGFVVFSEPAKFLGVRCAEFGGGPASSGSGTGWHDVGSAVRPM